MRRLSKYMPNFRDCIISTTASIREALAAIDKSGALLAAVVTQDDTLQGIFTDSDARRALLNGAALDDCVLPHLTTNPVVGEATASMIDLKILAEAEGVREIPLLDSNSRLVDVFVINPRDQQNDSGHKKVNFERAQAITWPMFLLAGGKGTRLKAVVQDVPKPLATVGGRPIIQTIIENAARYGVNKFFVSINFKAELIERHLKADFYKDLSIKCVYEEQFLGTAGSLGYLGENWDSPIIVANADALSLAPLDKVIEYHRTGDNLATCVVKPYDIQIPFGVVEHDSSGVSTIKEKPKLSFLVLTGLYVLSPDAKDYISKGEKLDMPELLKRLMANGQKVRPFLMHEYWRDIGRPEDYFLANEEFDGVFGAVNRQ